MKKRRGENNMKKKIVIVILILISCFIMTGCKSEQTSNNKQNNQSQEQKEKEIKVKVGEYEYDLSLTENSSFEKMKYKYPHATSVNSLGTYTLYTYPKTGEENRLFTIGITNFTSKTVEKAMAGAPDTVLMGTKTINGIDWQQYEVEGKNHTYAYEFDHDTYTISFLYDDDLGNFEEEFMKTVSFSK